MKKLLFATSLLIVISCTAHAQQTKKERIKYLMSLMGQDSMMSKMAGTMSSYMSKTAKSVGGDYGDNYDSAKNAKTMTNAMESVKDLMNTAMIESYDKHFTSAEIEDFITFYKSKSGQKWVKEQPEITSEMLMSLATKNQALIQKAMEEQQ